MYNFKAARQHIQLLTATYRSMKRHGAGPEALAWVASEIVCIEDEIAEAHERERRAGQSASNVGENILMFTILSHR